ncbi:hypothetical protein VNO78_20397 [Psophocarpus tetragonolobus]|uniref:Uncharacterized protein n=1 Tax=Psophocarpus tetragonolobus TaxID=3891 RepID=A0AAN9XGP3_PSOTE
MDALDIDKAGSGVGTTVAVSSTLFALVLIGRSAFVFPIANIKNRIRTFLHSLEKPRMITSTIPLIESVQLRHSKPAISDSIDKPENLRFLLPENNVGLTQSNNQPFQRHSRLSVLLSHPSTTVHYFWRRFNDKFMRPVFGGRAFVPFVPGEAVEIS